MKIVTDLKQIPLSRADAERILQKSFIEPMLSLAEVEVDEHWAFKKFSGGYFDDKDKSASASAKYGEQFDTKAEIKGFLKAELNIAYKFLKGKITDGITAEGLQAILEEARKDFLNGKLEEVGIKNLSASQKSLLTPDDDAKKRSVPIDITAKHVEAYATASIKSANEDNPSQNSATVAAKNVKKPSVKTGKAAMEGQKNQVIEDVFNKDDYEDRDAAKKALAAQKELEVEEAKNIEAARLAAQKKSENDPIAKIKGLLSGIFGEEITGVIMKFIGSFMNKKQDSPLVKNEPNIQKQETVAQEQTVANIDISNGQSGQLAPPQKYTPDKTTDISHSVG